MFFEVFSLLVLFQIKHFVADYPLQNKYMLGKFKPGWGFALPLLAHAGVHALFTLAICLWMAPNLWWLSIVDLITHFIMDRIKASPRYLGRFKALSGNEMMEIKDWCQHMDEVGWTNVGKEYFAKHHSPKLKGNTYFWWSLGLDQMVHHLVHYYIIFAIVVDKALTC